mmetsp:Transcript_36983/g.98532  ORF Transcript_36983/g.98532 Transcript_36983/m.98532 type:complete len:428 (-) Transcript_36983:285-1568(-)
MTSQAAKFLSARVRHTPPSAFEALMPLMRDPAVVNLTGGVPPPSTFPLQSMEVRLKDGTSVSISEEDTQLAQRYPPFAWGKLMKWTHGTAKRLWNPLGDWAVHVTAGSMSGVDTVFSMLLDDGDALLIEEFSFTASIDWLVASRIKCIPVKVDQDGIEPRSLRTACEQAVSAGLRVKALYTIPVGQNPTGSCLPAERAQEVYEIARLFDFLIVEDDAYYFLHHGANEATNGQVCSSAGPSFPPTFIGMDTDSRVIRLDSFSKVMAAGFRLGWITAHKDYIQAFSRLSYFSSQHGSSLSMMVLGSVLEVWKWDGFVAHVVQLQGKLRQKARCMLSAAAEHLDGVAEWYAPSSGMFLWVRLAVPLSGEDLLRRLHQYHVIALHGDTCSVQRLDGPTFLRLSYTLEDERVIAEGVRRLGQLLRAESAPSS